MIKLSDLEAIGFEAQKDEYQALTKSIAPSMLEAKPRKLAERYASEGKDTPFSFAWNGDKWKAKWKDGELIAFHWCHLITMARDDETLEAFVDEGKVLNIAYRLSFFPSRCAAMDVKDGTTVDDLEGLVKSFLMVMPNHIHEESANRIRAVTVEAKDKLKRTAVAVDRWGKESR